MYFPLQVGDVVIRKCNGDCENVPRGWTHLNKETNDDAIFRMVTEAQPNSNRAQRRKAKRKAVKNDNGAR